MITNAAKFLAESLGYSVVRRERRAAEQAEIERLRGADAELAQLRAEVLRLRAEKEVNTAPDPGKRPPVQSTPDTEPFDPTQLLTRPLGYPPPPAEGIYTPIFSYDGVLNDPKVIHNHDFMRDPRYVAAFAAGDRALGHDHKMFWRLHVALWCATQAARLEGDFVECGVWRGFLSTAILNYLSWPIGGKSFFLFDTYDGLLDDHLTEAERANQNKIEHLNRYFANQYDHAVANFAPYSNVEIVKGAVPETLDTVNIRRVCYLSLDLNCVLPELAAAEFFWDRMPAGAPLLLDDYGFVSYEDQKRGFDEFAKRKQVEILALPTGQGLILHP